MLWCSIDIDECSSSPDVCHNNATCTNTNGSFLCICQSGFTGNGSACTGNYCLCVCVRLELGRTEPCMLMEPGCMNSQNETWWLSLVAVEAVS